MANIIEEGGEIIPNGKSDGEMLGIKEKRKRLKIKFNRETIPLKITLFLFYGSMSAILPYVTIHMQSLGISITEVAIIYAVLPFTSFIGPPILGAVADKFGDYKWVLILAAFGNGLFHTLLLYVPPFHPPTPLNVSAVVSWDGSGNSGMLSPSLPQHCKYFDGSSNFSLTQSSLDLVKCGPGTADLPPLLHPDECSFAFTQSDVNVTFYLTNSSGFAQELICTGLVVVREPGIGNAQVTFWAYFLIRIVATIFMSSCFSLLDATTLAVVKRCGKAEYGKERIWSILGAAVISPIAGILVDRVSNAKGVTDYAPSFYLSDGLLVFSILTFFFLHLEVDKPEKGILKNGAKLFHYPEVVVFLVMIFLLGNLWGFVESYLFIFLKELEAPNYLLGLTLTAGSLVGLPFLWGSEKIVAKVGRVNLIIAAFVTYFFRFFGYSYLENPFWCFPFEAMEAFTYHLMWTAAATYCSLLAPKGMLASLMGIMGSLHYSLGKGAGSFFGGITYGKVGARLAFRYFGVIAGVLGLIFYLLDLFWIRKVVEARMSEKRKGEEGQEMRPLSRRGSIFDTNPFSATAAMLDLDEKDEGHSVQDKMIKS